MCYCQAIQMGLKNVKARSATVDVIDRRLS